MRIFPGLFAAVVICMAAPGLARPNGRGERALRVGQVAPPTDIAGVATAGQEPVVTHHQIVIDGKPLSYTVTAGFLPLRDQFRQTKAEVFFVAYRVDRVSGQAPRPLTFLWGGGPGSPSDLLQLGGLGPRRGRLRDEASGAPLSDRLVDNPNTWLTFTDMVFVDPVGTGYSYALSQQDLDEFWNAQGDIGSVAEFIRIYLTHYNAWNAPLFILGESYGTFRAAGVAEALAVHHVPLKGVILISPVLNFQLLNSGPENDLPYILTLPSYTAAAFAHKKLPPDLLASLPDALRKAQDWATSEYAVALMKGDRLSAKSREEVAVQLARFTGLGRSFVLKNNLRIPVGSFARELLADKHETLARYDTRLSYPTIAGPYNPTKDSSIEEMDRATRPILDYLRSELGFRTDAYYRGPFGGVWPYPRAPRADWTSVNWKFGPGVADESSALVRAMHMNPGLRVFVASGYFDLSTPFLEAEYTVDHMGLNAEQRKHVILARYHGGHAVYLDAQVRPRFRNDVAAFIQDTLNAVPRPPRK